MKGVYLSSGHGRSKEECEGFLGKGITTTVWNMHTEHGAFLICSPENWCCAYLTKDQGYYLNQPVNDFTEVFFYGDVLM